MKIGGIIFLFLSLNFVHQNKNKMQINQKENSSGLRSQRIQHIKRSLRKIAIISKNTHKIEEKIKHSNKSETQSPEIKMSYEQANIHTIGLKGAQEHSLFEEKYQVQECIGEGANGFVNRCRKLKNNKIYAVKSLMMDEEHIIGLKQNFMAIHDLKHPNIVEYHALYIDMRKKLCSIVMEYVKFPSLEKVKINDEQELKVIIYQLLDSVKYLHEKNISHRDIKPENILYDSQNRRIKIIDFGTSKKYLRRSKKCDMLTITGTLFYRAPQMFTGGGYDQKVDIWAIGILIYRLICGKTPFESIYLSDTINRIKDENLNFDDKMWEKYDPNLKKLIKRMTKKDKFQRLSAVECLRDVWFYSLTLNKMSESTKEYNTYWANLQNAQINKKIEKKSPELPKSLEFLNSFVQKVDGEDYHQIDSEEETECSKSSSKFAQEHKLKKRPGSSLIL